MCRIGVCEGLEREGNCRIAPVIMPVPGSGFDAALKRILPA